MPRLARVTVPGIPHHITQRGNRRQPVFFSDEDRRYYLFLLKEQGARFGIHIWAYCLMENHVHLIAVPETEESLARGIGELHRRYTVRVNEREGWTGYLWQGRFASFPLDERHLFAAVRYVERNPVRAGIVKRAEDYPWSSARAHVAGVHDGPLAQNFMTKAIPDWAEFLSPADEGTMVTRLEQHIRTGRPCGDKAFLTQLEERTGRRLQRQRAGRKKK
jgi:putative transposase